MSSSASTLIFYTNPMSRGQIARWALHEVGAVYDEQIIEYQEMKSPDYLAINPMGKVPAIVHSGKTVTECAAICAYLADAFPNAGLAPTPDERADYYRWLFFASGPIEQAVTNLALGVVVAEEQERSAGYGNYDRTMNVLDQMLQSNDYVCEKRFTMADVYVGAQVYWGLEFKSFPERDSFKAYAERVQSRSAYLEAKAIDTALLPES